MKRPISHMYPAHIFFANRAGELRSLLKFYNIPDVSFPSTREGKTIWCDTGEGMVIIVVMGVYPKGDDDQLVSDLTHEAVHVWQIIKDYIGETSPGCECEAYAIQFYASQLIHESRMYHKRILRSRKNGN